MFFLFFLAILVCPTIFVRRQWQARPPRNPNLDRPLRNAPFVVIHHTNTTECSTHASCANGIRRLQNQNTIVEGLNDIAYNFFITARGVVYEGRGWRTQAENQTAPGFLDRSLSIAFFGTFESQLPPARAMASYRALIECGRQMQIFPGNRNPRVIAHRQLRRTNCPGTSFLRYIMTWPEYDSNPKRDDFQ